MLVKNGHRQRGLKSTSEGALRRRDLRSRTRLDTVSIIHTTLRYLRRPEDDPARSATQTWISIRVAYGVTKPQSLCAILHGDAARNLTGHGAAELTHTGTVTLLGAIGPF